MLLQKLLQDLLRSSIYPRYMANISIFISQNKAGNTTFLQFYPLDVHDDPDLYPLLKPIFMLFRFDMID
jgi:hypothetical protein